MSNFVLLGARPFPHPELSPAPLGAAIAGAADFVASMRRWQLLDYFATGEAAADQPRAVLVAHASSPVAAAVLGAAWSRASGYDVTVWPVFTRCGGCAE
jgi:hypothetical protein